VLQPTPPSDVPYVFGLRNISSALTADGNESVTNVSDVTFETGIGS
jgi:hypothetical protein